LQWLVGAAVIASVIFAPGQYVLVAFWRALFGPRTQPGVFGVAAPAVVTGVIIVANLIVTVWQTWSLRRWGWVSSLLLPLPLTFLAIEGGRGVLGGWLIALGQALATAGGLLWAGVAGGAITIVVLIAYALAGPHPPEPPRWPGGKN